MNIGSEKKQIPRMSDRQQVYQTGGQEGGKGEVNFPSVGRRFGRKTERKKGSKEDLKTGRKVRCSTRPDLEGRRIHVNSC